MNRREAERVTLRAALRRGGQLLSECGIADAATDAWLLFAHVTGIDRAHFLADGGLEMEQEPYARYMELIEKRRQRIPVQHLTGEQYFMGLPFAVNEYVLIPRQDTEILVEEALRQMRPGMRVLDLCTGSGCIAVSLAKLGAQAGEKRSVNAAAAHGGAADAPVCIEASDISAQALDVARKNAARNGAQVQFVRSDLFAALPGKYDMIVSNPPYIRSDVIETLADEVRLHEPRTALDGREDGLYFYRRIVRESREHLYRGGRLLFEIGYDQAKAVADILRENGFEEIRVLRDLAGLDRVAAGVLSQ